MTRDDAAQRDQSEALALQQANREWQLAHQEKAVDLSKEGLRTLVLLNGAAAIALLAFIGQIIKDAPALVATLACALVVFVAGALLGGLATVAAYITQYLIAESATIKSYKRPSEVLHKIALALVAAGYLTFIVGAFIAASAIKAPPPAPPYSGPG